MTLTQRIAHSEQVAADLELERKHMERMGMKKDVIDEQLAVEFDRRIAAPPVMADALTCE
jgi:hypothetical protein